MKKLSSLITSFILFVAFLWATTGVTVYSHYCSESEGIYKSIFVEDANCEHHEEDKAIESCCTERKSCHTDVTDSDCCATQKQVFKLVSVFDVPGEKQQIKIDVFKLFEYKKIILEEKDNYVGEIKIPEELPHGNYGKKLLLAIHQRKIAPAPIV